MRGVGREDRSRCGRTPRSAVDSPQNMLLQAGPPTRGPTPPPWAAPASGHMTRSPHSWVQMTKNQKQVFKQTLYTHIHSSTAHNGPEVETTQVSIKG